ncbi:phospholipase d1 [Acrodontium crateriforme]|uniref:Phospholipase D1 n=1 Tax=Acrodontium crateriforme TaxID=150365 RepID=A0AAQ3M530_9PEZI|nr:phospholipase d1 [Acrodontium crateriforme]
MATMEAPRAQQIEVGDSSIPLTRISHDIPPNTELHIPNNEELKQIGGYNTSPSKVQQQLSTLDSKELPEIPDTQKVEHGNPTLAPSVRFGAPSLAGSFPFHAKPGTIGPAPTTKVENREHSPPQRRSVQFERKEGEEEPGQLQKTTTWETEDENETPSKERQASFFHKLKALASPGAANHTRGPSSTTAGVVTPTAALSPRSELGEPTFPSEAIEEADTDADGEEDSEDAAGDTPRVKKRRKSRRPNMSGADSAPTTPKQSRFASFLRDYSTTRPPGPSRQNTLSDVNESTRAGVSEDEGRDRLKTAWRKGIEGARVLSYSTRKQQGDAETPEPSKRPGNLRRLTGIGGLDSATSTPFRVRAERQATSSAQKWRQVKAGLKLLGQKKRDERMRVDHQKSAQLMAELLAGGPAALILASMYQRDEHGHRKVPVLLEQLKIRIPHSEVRKDSTGDRHQVFEIDLEYGNGPARMQWKIRRSLPDFLRLHSKYKVQSASDRVRHFRGEDKTRAKMPRFPKSAWPYARGARGLFADVEDEEEEQEATDGNDAADGSGTERPKGHRRRKSSFNPLPPRRTSTSEIVGLDPNAFSARQKEIYTERQRKKLEIYLQQMIRWLTFRADSTRLCKFLELSALAIRLSAEGGFQGKQGLLTIASRRNHDLRKAFAPAAFADRHKPRWFLVRHSYIVCVDGPESLNPYDVFLVDSEFRMEKRKQRIESAQEIAIAASEKPASRVKHHMIRLYNSERKLKLIARSERQHLQFQESLNQMASNTIWARKQRFNSFAPVRHNVWARWLVDGRDHMWQVSRAIDNAKDFIYIHDWWLSPELYMRRPAAISQKWRLDRLLQRKAQEGVKIFVIVYRNVESAIPIDSEYTKWSLLDLHENICVQRSPNQFRQNQFFWAHHEKLVVVDNMMAFVGGVDLCFGRWDDPCHTLTDDKLTGFELDTDVPRDSEHCQVWPGKDYSNPRVQDFYSLDRPYEEMYDRTKVPRMPWHDISMQMVGQPARDVGRHFVQRWNYVLRSRIPSRPTPVLLPPPEYEQEELNRLGMTGTCQLQILRSCASWSIGTPNRVEHSILNAYCHLITHSEHFVYIENQFFISSCTVEGSTIQNKIGDSLVERAIKAHENGEDWKACLVIPLMPGFQNTVDSQDGTSVRLIMQCQYRSICRGDTSIFARLRARGIDPEQYIRFYSLRQWGKIGPRQCLTTEQLYIHAKCMVVDDRSVIIGSANINERSLLGTRDSEVCALVTDTKMIPSRMGGKPYMVGEFAHTLRKRLMREHLGIDVDAIYRREQGAKEREDQDAEMERIYRDDFDKKGEEFETPSPSKQQHQRPDQTLNGPDASTNGRVITPNQSLDSSDDTQHGDASRDLDVQGYGVDNMKALVAAGDDGLTDSFVDAQGHEVLVKSDAPTAKIIRDAQEQAESKSSSESKVRQTERIIRPPWPLDRGDTYALGLTPRSQLPELPALDDTDIGGPPLTRGFSASSAKAVHPLLQTFRSPIIDEDCMTDPLHSKFYEDVWEKVAENNTKLYRMVFRCMPDSEVLDWKTYEKYNDYSERFMQSQGLGNSKPRPPKEAPGKSGPPGIGATDLSAGLDAEQKAKNRTLLGGFVNRLRPTSRTSNIDTPSHVDDTTEKPVHRSDSQVSAPSDPAVAVRSSESPPLDENDAVKQCGDSADAEKSSVGLSLQSSAQQKDDGNGVSRQRTTQSSETPTSHGPETTATASNSGSLNHSMSQKRRRRGTTKSSGRPQAGMDEVLGREEAEELLKLVQGRLVTWPYDWLEKEERGGNWLYNIDGLAPLEIYD